jgi:hypothetical protein
VTAAFGRISKETDGLSPRDAAVLSPLPLSLEDTGNSISRHIIGRHSLT